MCVCVCVCVYLSARAVCDTKSIFLVEFYWSEFRVFLLVDRLPYQGCPTIYA